MTDKQQDEAKFKIESSEESGGKGRLKFILIAAFVLILVAAGIGFLALKLASNAEAKEVVPTMADGKIQGEKLKKKRIENERRLGQMEDRLVENPAVKKATFAESVIKEFERMYDKSKQEKKEKRKKEAGDFEKNLEKYDRFDSDRYREEKKRAAFAIGQAEKKSKSMVVIADEGKAAAGSGGSSIEVDRIIKSFAGVQGAVFQKRPLVAEGSSRESKSVTISYNSEFPMVTLFEGEYLEGVVLTEIRSDIQAGPVIVKTSRDFYDESGVYVIIPYGTKITGRSQAIDYQGQQRLYIWFERLILPVRTVGERRAAIRLPAAGMALDSRGTAGLVSKVNRHFWLQYGSAILLGVLDGLTGLAQRRAGNGSLSVMVDGSGQNLSQVNASRFSRYSSIMPTVTVNPGTKVKVYMACDIHITAYDLKENRSYAAAIKGGNRE